MRTKLWAALFTGLSLGGSLQAQPLTWEDCVALAAKKNPDLLASIRASEAGRAQYFGSFNAIFPHLSLIHSYSESSNSGSGSGQWQAAATASIDLLDAARWADIKSASAVRDS